MTPDELADKQARRKRADAETVFTYSVDRATMRGSISGAGRLALLADMEAALDRHIEEHFGLPSESRLRRVD
jgi:hypothetical protein